MEVYLGGMCGSPCCRVLTVSNECISMSPVVPPIPPASIACDSRLMKFGELVASSVGIHGYRVAAPVHRPPPPLLQLSSPSYPGAIRRFPSHCVGPCAHHLRVCSGMRSQTSRRCFPRPWAMQRQRMRFFGCKDKARCTTNREGNASIRKVKSE